MNISLIIMEGKYDDIGADDFSCHGYYIIKFYLSPYTLQTDLIIYGQFIPSGEMVCEGDYLFQININSHYYFLQKTKSIYTIVSLRKILYCNGNIICYDSKGDIPPCLQSISHNY